MKMNGRYIPKMYKTVLDRLNTGHYVKGYSINWIDGGPVIYKDFGDYDLEIFFTKYQRRSLQGIEGVVCKWDITNGKGYCARMIEQNKFHGYEELIKILIKIEGIF